MAGIITGNDFVAGSACSYKSNSLSVMSYNMHGYNQGCTYIKDVCMNQNYDIIFLQEHWLYPSTLSKLANISEHYSFFGISAMQTEINNGFIRGRPYGGTAVLIHKNIANLVVESCTHDRVVGILLGDVLLLNVYFPCCDGSVQNIDVSCEILANLANIIDSYQAKYIIFGGDFNTSLIKPSKYADIILEFMNEYGITVCKSILFGSSSINFTNTYVNESLNASSCIDFICVSRNMVDNVIRYDVNDAYNNHSDHLPVSVSVCLPVNTVLYQCIDSGNSELLFNAPKSHCLNQPVNSGNRKLRWDKGNTGLYHNLTYEYLLPIHESLQCMKPFQCHPADNDSCRSFINETYTQVVSALQFAANNSIPETTTHTLKHWWNSDLNRLKQKSMLSHSKWLNAGKTRTGEIFQTKQQDKLNYKRAIKAAKIEAEDKVSDSLHQNLCSKNNVAFWKTWKNKIKKPSTGKVYVEGCTTDEQAAQKLADYFCKATSPNSKDFDSVKKSEFYDKFRIYPKKQYNDKFSAGLIESAASKMSVGKAAGVDQLTIEHIHYCHVIIYSLLAKLFNVMLYFSCVPDAFGCGMVTAIPKDETRRKTHPVDNFRGITVSPMLSKLFEHCLLSIFNEYFKTSENQFGFKTNVGCPHAIYAVRKVTEYFIENESTVNICLLDITKGFDKVNNFELMQKLMTRRTPSCLIELLQNWFSISQSCVKWNSTCSDWYVVSAGVRQGGVLSPTLFAVYVNEMLEKVKMMGCKFNALNVGAFMYADDIVLLSPSIYELQRMVIVCKNELENLDLTLSINKSKAIRIGKRFNSTAEPLRIGEQTVCWSNEAKYLGIVIRSAAKFKCQFDAAKMKFYRSANSILHRLGNNKNTTINLYLIATIALPVLTYSIEALLLTKTEINSLFHPWYVCLCRIFCTFDSDVIKDCCDYLGYKAYSDIYLDKLRSFLKTVKASNNKIVSML